MSNKQKRYRQTSIFESFALSKRQKNNNSTMEESVDNRKPCTVAEEKIISPHSVFHELENLENVCRAAEDSVKIKSESHEVKGGTSNQQQNDDTSFTFSDDLFPSEPLLEDHAIPSSSNSEELFKDSANDKSESQSAAVSVSDSDSDSDPDSDSDTDSHSDDSDQMAFLNRMPDCSVPLPKLTPSTNHSIMFSPHIRPGKAPLPYPSSYRDIWDGDHVRMPCSFLNRCVIENLYGNKAVEHRWDIICQSLRSEIGSSQELENAIMKYNPQHIGKWNFIGLHHFINKILTEEERDHFFEILLPGMIKIALQLPHICTQPIPLLKSGKDHYVTMSQKQVGSLLSNAFFCTFPRRNCSKRNFKQKWTSEYSSYPDINFNRIFEKNKIQAKVVEKLKCLFNYFKRIISNEPSGTITFHRQSFNNKALPNWHASTRGLSTAVIRSSGVIETEGHGMLQVDFANKYVGGGVLGTGCVQEEIRFVICPELLVSRLFVECLDIDETLIVTGVEQYNKYSGYGETFKWEGDFRDEMPRDSWGRRCTQLVAMDAISLSNSTEQFKFKHLKRELNKAYCGFYENDIPAHLPAVATGNWGCGVFNGNPNFKFLIQLMAASEAHRSVLYFTFGNKKLKKEFQEMYEFLNDKNLVVGDIWRLLMNYADEVVSRLHRKNRSNLYDFIYSQFVTKGENSRQKDDGKNEDQFLDDSDKRALNKLIEDVKFDSSTEIEDFT